MHWLPSCSWQHLVDGTLLQQGNAQNATIPLPLAQTLAALHLHWCSGCA
jgi:hypothetical protein